MLDRLRTGIADHPRARTGMVVAVAAGLVAVAVVLAFVVLRAPLQTGQLDTSPTAQASIEPSVAPSPATPSPSPTPAPTAQARTEFPMVTPADFAPLPPSWGIVMVNRLNVRAGPGEEHPVVGVLNEGDLVQVIEGAAWVEILADGLHGWALAIQGDGRPDELWIRAVPTPSSWTSIAGVASNERGYVAYGTWAELDYPPYEGGFEQPLILSSADGVVWEEVLDGPHGRVTDVAAGPDGFVATGYHAYGAATTAFSGDGRLWTLPTPLFGQQHAVAYGPVGWVIVAHDHESGWHAIRSRDGRTWDDATALPGEVSGSELEASSAGYVTFDRSSDAALASTDGRSWRAVELDLADGTRIADVELVGDRLLVLTVSDGGLPTIQRGTLGADALVTWTTPADGSAFANARLDSISTGGSGLLALGWGTDTLLPVAWTSADGSAWTRIDLPADALGGAVGPEPVWGSGGWVGVGETARGSALYRSNDGRSWSWTAEPSRSDVPDVGCPAVAEVSVLSLLFLGDRAYDCFGNASLTVRGWVPEGGWGGCCFPDPHPVWLAGTMPANTLVPAQVERLGLGLYLPPDVDTTALRGPGWVEIVGHYGDPAAESCRRTPLPSYPQRLESQERVRDECARRFVVESARQVDGP